MRTTRGVLGVLGVALVLVGVWRLLDIARTDFAKLLSTGVWLAGGVIAHDAVIAPLALGVGFLVVPRLPRPSRAPAAAGLIVLFSITLLAIPVIGRFGAKPDNPSLLDRPYGALWLVFAALVLVGVIVASVASIVRGRRAS